MRALDAVIGGVGDGRNLRSFAVADREVGLFAGRLGPLPTGWRCLVEFCLERAPIGVVEVHRSLVGPD